jgi:hypothetical protein
MECNAIVGHEPGPYGFRPVECTQVVGVRGYWAVTERWENTGHFVSYCALPGHEQNVRRRFAQVDSPEPRWLHEDPEYADPITAGKGYHDWQAGR